MDTCDAARNFYEWQINNLKVKSWAYELKEEVEK
jgi:hypothetical protein